MAAAVPVPEDPTHEVTRLLEEIRAGNKAASDRLFTILLPELRRLASHFLGFERKDHTLQTTALVNEAYLKLTAGATTSLQNRGHFFAVAASAMRQVLVDHARTKKARKRGGSLKRVELTDALHISDDGLMNVLLIHDALLKLERLDPRQVRIVEMRFFLELSNEEIAETLNLSPRTVIREWRSAQSWLTAELSPQT